MGETRVRIPHFPSDREISLIGKIAILNYLPFFLKITSIFYRGFLFYKNMLI